MSRGPLPAEVYWRRRFLLLAVVLLLAWGIVTAWPDGGGAQTTAPEPEPSASDASTASPGPTPEDEGEGEGPETREATVSLSAGGDPCDPESIRMTPHVPPDQTTKGEVAIQLTMSTSATEPCTFRPKAADVAAVISSGGNAVWDSEVCRSVELVDGPVALSPQWSTVATATWSGRGSGPACAKDEGWASPGKYALRIGTLGGEPGKTTFRLAAAPAKEKDTDEKDEDEKDDADSAGAESGDSAGG